MPEKITKWTPADFKVAKKKLSESFSVEAAAKEITKELKRPISKSALRNAFTRAEQKSPGTFLKVQPKRVIDESEDPATARAKLIELIKTPIAYSELCDKLDLSPKRVKAILDKAKADGVKVHLQNQHVGIYIPEPVEQVRDLKIAPVVGERQQIAVISDLHLGSKFCMREQLKDFIHYAYSKGVRTFLSVGDNLDGCYAHGKWELTHHGLEEQCEDLFETIPNLPGMTLDAITGNHDETFFSLIGADVGEYISAYCRRRGRNNVRFRGDRGAYLKVRGAVIHLWHPRDGGAYAVSYGIQKKVESYSSIKPQILLTGHWHKFCYVYERNIHAIACPTFQAGGSRFSKSLKGQPAIGGLILGWDVTRDGGIRGFNLEKRSYFEVETPIDVRNPIDAIGVQTGDALRKFKKIA